MKAQGEYNYFQPVKLTHNQVKEIKQILSNQDPKDSIYDIIVSKCLLIKFHEFGDYGPYIDGETRNVYKWGFQIQYRGDNIKAISKCHFHEKEDNCCGMKTGVTLFLPDDMTCYYRSYLCSFGFPPSYGGAAKRKEIEKWHRKLVKIIRQTK